MMDESSSSEFSDSASSDSSSFGVEFEVGQLQQRSPDVQPWRFEPQARVAEGIDQNHDEEEAIQEEPLEVEDRLNNTDWCDCGFCQIMDRRVECICCHGVPQIVSLKQEAVQNGVVNREPSCIVLHPGFQAVCLNMYVLKVAWLQYKQQYGNSAFEGPEHKQNRHIAYRQLVRWGWGVLGKEIRVVLPSCAVSCIRAHFHPPGLEENFNFIGFLYADE